MAASRPKLAIVGSQFNEEITSEMFAAAIDEAKKSGAQVVAAVKVPGAYEIPFATSKLLARKDVDAIATVGAVIKGETKHDEAITIAMAHALLSLSLKHGKPVGLGVIGPGATEGQARARSRGYARRSVQSALHMLKLGY